MKLELSQRDDTWSVSCEIEGALLDANTRVMAKISDDAYPSRITFPRYEAHGVLDRTTGMMRSLEIPRGQIPVHTERAYVIGSL